MYYEFSGREGAIRCLPAGDYAIQVLGSSADAAPPSTGYREAWSYGSLGTRFILKLTTVALPSIGLFRLDAADEFNAINGLNPLAHGVTYPSTPAVFIFANTVLPEEIRCPEIEKAIYREFNIGDFDLDGVADEGMVCINGMRTDVDPGPYITYQFFQGDANQLASSAGTHAAGEQITGLTDYLGFCIDDDDTPNNTPGIHEFCACVTTGTYTIASYGNTDHVSLGDSLAFTLNTRTTIHDSREKSELITIPSSPDTVVSGPDYFSCNDNLGSMPPCGDRRKLIYREFFLPDSAVMTITEIGNGFSVLSLFSGRASELSEDLTLIADCFHSAIFVDYCTPFPPGWYTIQPDDQPDQQTRRQQ
jgi:hypothetical protein